MKYDLQIMGMLVVTLFLEYNLGPKGTRNRTWRRRVVLLRKHLSFGEAQAEAIEFRSNNFDICAIKGGELACEFIPDAVLV